eukprot:7277950-Pyramimonas_sp.AAC.1
MWRHVCGGVMVSCERSHWALRLSSPWGHEACEGCAEMRAVVSCERSTGAFGLAPYGAAKRVK